MRLLAPDPQTADRLQEILRDLEHEVPVVAAPARPRAARGPGGRRARRVRVPGARPRLPHRDRALRAPPDHAPAADVPARGGDRRVHRPRAGRPGRPRRARDRPVHRARHAGGGRAARRLPPPRVRRRRASSISRSSGWPPSRSTPASGSEAPRLDKLGATTWQRTKESVRASLREMAQELLRLYAERQVVEGLAIAPDTPWQHEFEAAFAFEETPDQLEAIRQVKADLERRQPMDRLVCGDVGYGKTEVAMRAALKVALDGHQVAVLVPTTILAEQHWNTFRERFAPYPVRVEMLSRFRSPAQQKAVLAGLAAGTVDVVIGTHRLLSKDVAFKNLGLLVVDEEHRFGVAHKERMKQLRKSVHVLTLTATPIPRTLSMAMAGIRDLSVIESPPADRLAVETVVVPVRRPGDQGGDRARAGPGWPGVRGPQPHPVLAGPRPPHPAARPARAGRDGPWPAAGVDPRTNHAGLRGGRVRCARGHGHHRVGAGHPGVEHDHHQPGGPAGARAALPAPRPGGPRSPPGVRLPPDSRGRPRRRDGGQAAPGDPGADGARLGAQGRAPRHGDPGGREPARRAAARPDRDGRLRPLPEALGGGRPRASRGGRRGRDRLRSSRSTPPPICPTTTSPSPPSGWRSTSGSRASGPRPRSRTRGGSSGTGSVRCPRRPRASSTS